MCSGGGTAIAWISDCPREEASIKNWAQAAVDFLGDDSDCLILKFGKPPARPSLHMDSIGFTVRYTNQLVSISPDAKSGTKLVIRDALGDIECELELDKEGHAFISLEDPFNAVHAHV